MKPEASNAVERSQLRRNDDVMDDRNTEEPRGKLRSLLLSVQYVDGVLRERTGKRSEDGGGDRGGLVQRGVS